MFPRDEYEIDLYMVTDSIDVVELTRQMDAADIRVKRVLFTNKDTDDETMAIQLQNIKTTQRTQYEPSMGHLYITRHLIHHGTREIDQTGSRVGSLLPKYNCSCI
jgi:hypothetical protein